MAVKRSFPVIDKYSGYEPYKDTTQFRRPNVKAIFTIIATIAGVGFVGGLIVMLALSSATSNSADVVSAPPIIQATNTQQSFSVAVSSPQPTYTASPTVPEATPTHYLQATLDANSTALAELVVRVSVTPVATATSETQATLDIAATQLSLIQTMQPTTITPQPTTISVIGNAVVIVDAATIRIGPGQQFKPVGMGHYGDSFPVIGYKGEWTELHIDRFSSAWIASWLLKEDDD